MISVPPNVTSAAHFLHAAVLPPLPSCSHTMILYPAANDPASIFADGKLKPGIYKIQNLAGHTYLDIRDESKELCCRPATVLEGKGFVRTCLPLFPHIPTSGRLQWEILPLGPGYTIRRVRYSIAFRPTYNSTVVG